VAASLLIAFQSTRPPPQRRLPAEEVLADRDILKEAALLEDYADPRLLRGLLAAELAFHALDGDDALVPLVDAGEYLHERALARAVLSDEGVHLALLKVEVDPVEGLHPGEGLAYPSGGQHGGHIVIHVHRGIAKILPAGRRAA
jgi:hypothetical protein